MASEIYDHTVTWTTTPVLLETRTWTHIWAMLESNPDGVNRFGYGSSLTRIEPGTIIQHIVAPGTQVKFTSTGSARWSVLATELGMVDDILNVLCALGGGV